MSKTHPFSQELVFIGGGHTHALVLRSWGMRPLPGARLTLINPGPTAPYTGMLPGFVAGHYQRADLSIDLVRLARFAGARLILGAVDGIDLNHQRIHLPGRPPVAYDVASVNVGITSDLPALPGFSQHGVGAKPLGVYARAWLAFKDALARGEKRPEIAVIGGGVGGVELALAMAHALQAASPLITVIDRSEALTGLASAARAALLSRMQALGVTLCEHARPASVTAKAVILEDGSQVASQFTVGAAGARPHDWVAGTGLAHQDGFLTVDPHLQSSDPQIYAAGDCAALPDPRPKAGVFAVREAPVLHHNLRVAVSGQGSQRAYKPQSSYLKLVSLGPKEAVADKWGGRLQGAWVWRWKDRIDRKFMDQFADLKPMAPATLPSEHAVGLAQALGPKPLCGGCGAKVGSGTLDEVLGTLPQARRADVETLHGDDAAVLNMDGTRQVLSTDHLRAFTDDPYLMAKIAAVHALGDVWAMGAQPQAALAQLILPRMAGRLQAGWLAEIMAAGSEVFTEAGAQITGGHTTLGDELTIGFTVTGLLQQNPITLSGARPGDMLILTKPIGSGTVLAAEMQLQVRGDWVADALAQMCQPQGAAAAILKDARAMTDVTGFGLAGHLLNICRASGVSAQLRLDAVPLMNGAEELAGQGVRSTLFEANRAAAPEVDPANPRAALLFDPQTAGGLLAAMPPGLAEGALTALATAGYQAVNIGEITPGPASLAVG